MGDTKHAQKRPEQVHDRMKQARKAQAFAFFILLAFLFVLAIMYLVVNHTYSYISNSSLVPNASSDYHTTWLKLDYLWGWFLVLASFFALVWMIISSIRGKTDGDIV